MRFGGWRKVNALVGTAPRVTLDSAPRHIGLGAVGGELSASFGTPQNTHMLAAQWAEEAACIPEARNTEAQHLREPA